MRTYFDCCYSPKSWWITYGVKIKLKSEDGGEGIFLKQVQRHEVGCLPKLWCVGVIVRWDSVLANRIILPNQLVGSCFWSFQM